jgi:beta-lactam-binding protein with PASTA domain
VTLAVDEEGDVVVPSLLGKTMREVTRECIRLGLDPVLAGTGVALQQSPQPGAKLRRGRKIVIRFGSSATADRPQNTKSRGGAGTGK